MSKIIDSFMYFNEDRILELRLKELYDYVDYFVIVESDVTHLGQYKGYNFENIPSHKLAPYWDKIKYFKTHLYFPNGWGKEKENRNQIAGCVETLRLDNDDVIIVSDCDEIPNRDIFPQLGKYPITGLVQLHCLYYANLIDNGVTTTSIAMTYEALKNLNRSYMGLGLLKLREQKNYLDSYLFNGGWHYSYFGGGKKVEEKGKSIAEGSLELKRDADFWNKKAKEAIDTRICDVAYNGVFLDDFSVSSKKLQGLFEHNGMWNEYNAVFKIFPDSIIDFKEFIYG